MKILVVDDDEIFRMMLSEVLEEAGFEISAHENGRLAWESLQSEGADIVVTDVNMPEMGGFELLKLIRGDARFASIPVVVMAIKANVPEDVERGADDYLLKPFPNEDLVAMVKALEQRILGAN